MQKAVKLLLLALVFGFLFLNPTSIFADDYFFQEEFNQERPANTLDALKWKVYPNTSFNFASVKETGGNLHLDQKNLTSQFPLIVSKNQSLPDGDFSAEIKFQYTKVTYWGTGIALADSAPINDGKYNPLISFAVWQDQSQPNVNMRLQFNQNIVYTTSINTNIHTFRVDRTSKKYLLYLDGQLVFTSPDIDTQVKYIWMGNPALLNFNVPEWTKFNVDYIRVKDLTPPPLPSKTPLIFIPGIGGSELKVAEDTFWVEQPDGHGGTYSNAYTKDERVWVNQDEAKNFGDDDYFDILRLKPDGQTSEANLDLTGNLFDGAYKPTIDFFTSNGYTLNKDLFIFPYDWRKDLSLTKPLLDAKIDAILSQTGGQKVDIVAHSMGGLVARNYISDLSKAQKVRKLITLGTPHLGSVDMLKGLMYGTCLTKPHIPKEPVCFGINPSETKDLLQNMTGTYQLLPSQKYFTFYSELDNSHPFPFRDDRDIDNNSIIGPLNYNQTKDLLTNLGYNTFLFNPAETFHNIDNILDVTNGVDVTIISGSGIDTIGQIIERYKVNFAGIKKAEKDAWSINGDNTVPLFSSSLYDAINGISIKGNAKNFYSNQTHGSLVDTGASLNLTKNILAGDISLPSGISLEPFKLSGKLISVHSPINIHVYDSNGNHTGPTPNGDFEENIPGSSYDTLDDAKFVFLPDDGIYSIKLEATDHGSFDFKIRDYSNDQLTKTDLYKDIPLTDSTKAEATLDTNSVQSTVLRVDEDGDGQSDADLNPTSILEGTANFDQTAPESTVKLTGTKGNDNWYKSEVTVEIDALDETNGSGIAKTEYSIDDGQTVALYSGPFTVSSEGLNKLKIKSEDLAGNEEIPQETEFKIDRTNPTPDCNTADGIWHANDVSIDCRASDNGSGLINPADGSFSLVTSVTSGTETDNALTDSRNICDVAGNCTVASPITGSKVDKKSPDITITTPLNSALYALNQIIKSDYSCTDPGSGSGVCSGTMPNGSNIDTSTVGPKILSVNAQDNVGNNSAKTATYNVVYASGGTCLNEPGHTILQPINPEGSSVFKQGSSIPAKFRVCDAEGNSIGTTGVISNFMLVKTQIGTIFSNINESVHSTTPDTSYRWDSTSKQWIYNINTKALFPNTTYFYQISLNDGTAINFSFGLK